MLSKLGLFLLSGNEGAQEQTKLRIKNEESFISAHLRITINLKPNERSIQKGRNINHQ